jgi:hypothetical protein
MRTATAITLVLLGGGATVMAVHATRQCKDPETGQEIACSSTHYSGSSHYTGSHYTGSHYYWSSSSSSSGYRSSSSSSVSRGGFGGSGGSFHFSGS